MKADLHSDIKHKHKQCKPEVMSAGLLSGRSRVQTLARPPTRVFKITGKIMLAVMKTMSQFRWSRHWAVTLSRWPCLLHTSLSVGRGRKRTHTALRRPQWCGLSLMGGGDCHGPAVIGFTMLRWPCQYIKANMIKLNREWHKHKKKELFPFSSAYVYAYVMLTSVLTGRNISISIRTRKQLFLVARPFVPCHRDMILELIVVAVWFSGVVDFWWEIW